MRHKHIFKRNKFIGNTDENPDVIDVIIECKNCGTSFKGNYCPNCGQSTDEFNRPFSVMIYDFMGTMFAFDTRLLKTLKSLIISPGRYSSEFVEGKRARYMQPFKFYVFISFVFFLLLHFKTQEFISANSDNLNPAAITAPLSAKDSTDVNSADAIIQKSISKLKEHANNPVQTAEKANSLNVTGSNKTLDSAQIKNLKSALLLATDSKTADSLTRVIQNKIALEAAQKHGASNGSKALDKTERDQLFATKNIKKLQYLLLKAYNSPKTGPVGKRILANTIRLMDFPGVFVSRLLHYFSWSLFVLVPFFALWLWFFFHKSRKFYFSHLVYSLASLSTTFLILSVIFAIKLIFPNKMSAPENYLLWLIPIYIWLGLKHFYKKSIWGTTIRFLTLSMIYWFTTFFAVCIVFFLSVYF